jgi:hypothetical protein
MSVDQLCWDCTVSVAKNKVPLYVEPREDESHIMEGTTGNIGFW